MATVVAPDASLAQVLRSLRGEIAAAYPAYPDVLHVEIRDPNGDLWRLATQDAEWSPSDPEDLLGHSVEDAGLDEASGELRLSLSGGKSFTVVPAPYEAEDDPPNWKLLTPDGLVLVFGPGGRWHVDWANEPGLLPLRQEAHSESADALARKDLVAVLAREEAVSRQLLRALPATQALQTRLAIVTGLSAASLVAAAASLIASLR